MCKNGRTGEECDGACRIADGTIGEVLDDHDNNRKYQTTMINCREWMAENYKRKLDYYDAGPYEAGGHCVIGTNPYSYCYPSGNKDNVDTYGLLYNWEVAKSYAFCPTGWHLPSVDELRDLLDYMGGESTGAKNLRATTWNQGTGKYGFNVPPAGGYSTSTGSFSFGSEATFWSQSKLSNSYPYVLQVDNYNASVKYTNVSNYYYSVRCIKDLP